MSHQERLSILCFGGTDPAGLAGLQMDIKTAVALGVHCFTVTTANTAQNNKSFVALNPTTIACFKSQLESVSALPTKVVKTGLVANVDQANEICRFVESKKIPLVIDPVISATSGGRVSEGAHSEVIKCLFPMADLITPNIPEAEYLSGKRISTRDDMVYAARVLLDTGVKSVFLKGGHWQDTVGDDNWRQDFFCSEERSFWLSSPKIHTENTRGTGCALATSVASALALGYSIYDAVVIGKMAIQQGLRQSYGLQGEKGSVAIDQFPDQEKDLPILSHSHEIVEYNFPSCGNEKLGLYPIFDRAHWLERILPLGVSTAQLRVKDLEGDALEAEIAKSVEIAQRYNCRLFINDYWELAIKHNAYGVHLGQEDLDEADVSAVQRAGLRLGTSTHCYYEVARAHRFRPSYMAFGPVWSTTTKQMPWVPQGERGFAYWSSLLNYPLVGIGGVNKARIPLLRDSGADGIAMITAITDAEDPIETTKSFLNLIREND